MYAYQRFICQISLYLSLYTVLCTENKAAYILYCIIIIIYFLLISTAGTVIANNVGLFKKENEKRKNGESLSSFNNCL